MELIWDIWITININIKIVKIIGFVNTLYKQYSQLINKHLQESYSNIFRDKRQQLLLRLSVSLPLSLLLPLLLQHILQQQSVELLTDYEPVYARLIEENASIENNLIMTRS